MSRRMLLAVASAATLIVAACGGGAATGAPAASQPATSEAPAASESAAGGGAACAPSTEAGTVQAVIADFAFDPATINASVGDVVAWTNNDGTGHTATVDSDESCTTETLAGGATGAIVFNTAGSYPYHCKIHSNMTGTVEVS